MGSKIKLVLVLGVVVLVMAGYGFFRANPGIKNQTDSRPQIEVAPDFFDFGEVEFGQVVEQTFAVRNVGDEALEITRVSTSCGCTTAETSKKNISPGEETKLKVVYDTGAMSGSHAKGKQERTIYVKSNDPVNPQVEVAIRAIITDG